MGDNMSFEWINENSLKFLNNGYLLPDEDAKTRIREIADSAQNLLKIKGFADKFYDYMGRGFYSLSSPVWANFGRTRGLPISCNGSYLGDDMASILTTLSEVGMQTKHGAGTSGYFGNIRPRGTPINSGGVADGPVAFMRMFETMMDVVSQGNVRRGSFAAYLDIDHPDIEEFLEVREVGNEIQNMSIGVCISDAWMNGLIAEGDAIKQKTISSSDAKKVQLWAKVLRKRKETGYPYIFFSDNVNNNKPQVLKDKDYTVWASNLCIAGSDRVVSNHGYLTAKELHDIDSELTLFDNNSPVKSTKMKIREKDVDTFTIVLENGMEHTVTDYHKVMVKTHKNKNVMIPVSELKKGDRVCIQTNKGLFGKTHMPKEAFLLGMYQADGTQHKNRVFIDVWENDFDLINEIQDYINYVYKTYKPNEKNTPSFNYQNTSHSVVKKQRIGSTVLSKNLEFKKGHIPNWIWESDEETQWQFIRGLFYADGTVNVSGGKGSPMYLSLSSIDEEYLKKVQLILHNLGIQCSIGLVRPEGKTSLPDGKGSYKEYNTVNCYRLTCGNKNDALHFDERTSFLKRKGVFIENRHYRNNTKKSFKVKEIIYAGKQDVFCPTVYSDDHMFVSQGIITSNCSEIAHPSSDIWSFVCCLASMNVLKWDEWKETDAVEVLTYFLDAVMEEYIQKTDKIQHMKTSNNFARHWRALGIGQLGWHTLLQSKMIPFESYEAMTLTAQIAEFMDEKSMKASQELAQLFGEPDGMKGYGQRNLTRLAIAPTTSSSFICGQVSPSIEPLIANYFVKNLAKGSFTYVNPYLKNVLETYGKDTDEVWENIRDNRGSVQHLGFLSHHEKEVFKTFEEISPMAIIQQAAVRQQFIDQSQSLNLMIPHNTPMKDINALLIEAWKLGIKTLYYQRSTNVAQETARSILQCIACEA
jgi:ribonucleoside-diphosphate reductase alpha chain